MTVKNGKASSDALTQKYLQDVLSENFKVYNGVIKYYNSVKVK